jgi:hypothetical protein
VFAVPRSIDRSLEKKPRIFLNNIKKVPSVAAREHGHKQLNINHRKLTAKQEQIKRQRTVFV